jgi:hypothetical protein
MAMCPCKYLDFTEGKYTDCKIVELTDFSCRVRYWERGPIWTEGPGNEGNPKKVQFCGQGRGRINGIFQCYNPDEMGCYVSGDAALAKREEEISGDIMDDETEKEWLDRVTTPAPDALREATFKEIARAVRSADAGFEAAGDAGTKTWIEEYFLPALSAGGLTIMARAALASKKGGTP